MDIGEEQKQKVFTSSSDDLIFTENIGDVQKKGPHVLRCPVYFSAPAIKWSRGLDLARGPYVAHPCVGPYLFVDYL